MNTTRLRGAVVSGAILFMSLKVWPDEALKPGYLRAEEIIRKAKVDGKRKNLPGPALLRRGRRGNPAHDGEAQARREIDSSVSAQSKNRNGPIGPESENNRYAPVSPLPSEDCPTDVRIAGLNASGMSDLYKEWKSGEPGRAYSWLTPEGQQAVARMFEQEAGKKK